MLIGIFRQINMQDKIFLVLVPAIAVIVFDVRFVSVVFSFFLSVCPEQKLRFGK
jgi:hypothetical protein